MTSSKASNKTKQKGRKTKIAESDSKTLKFVSVYVRTLAIAFLSALLISLIAGAIIIRTPDPCGAILPVSLSTLYFTSMLFGFLSQKSIKGPVLLIGLISGIVFILFIITVSSFIPAQSISSSGMINRPLVISLLIPSSMLGVVFGNTRLIKKRRSNHSRRK